MSTSTKRKANEDSASASDSNDGNKKSKLKDTENDEKNIDWRKKASEELYKTELEALNNDEHEENFIHKYFTSPLMVIVIVNILF
jgi:hypothetical protein